MNYEELEELLIPINKLTVDASKETLNRPVRDVRPQREVASARPSREVRCYMCNSIMTEKHYYPNSSTIPGIYYVCVCNKLKNKY